MMIRTEAPGAVQRRALLALWLVVSSAAPASPSAADFSLKDGMAQMASFRNGTFTMRAKAEFARPDGYVALAFGSPKLERKYYLIVTRSGMKFWKLGNKGERKLLDTGPLDLTPGQEIRLKFAIKGRQYFAEVAGYPPLIAEDEDSFKGQLVLRAAGATIDYSDPLVEVERKDL
jgi:hypothetical protein